MLNFAAEVALEGDAKSEDVIPFSKELGWLVISQKYKHDITTTKTKRLISWSRQ